MTTLALPLAPKFKQARFALASNALTHASPLNGSVQTVEFPGARWQLTASLPPMQRATAGDWQAFFTKLRGLAGRFYAGDPNAAAPRGTALGTPLVNGAGQTGTTLVTDGWTISQAQALLPGDYFQVGYELKLVVATVVSNGSGAATITFEPPLRASPADNAPIITSNPVCIMRLSDPNQGWDIEPASIYGFSFSAIESFT
jgi:hypothetical protein